MQLTVFDLNDEVILVGNLKFFNNSSFLCIHFAVCMDVCKEKIYANLIFNLANSTVSAKLDNIGLAWLVNAKLA